VARLTFDAFHDGGQATPPTGSSARTSRAIGIDPATLPDDVRRRIQDPRS
jgi:hypothetical protein